MTEYFFLLCIVLRHTRRSGVAQRDLMLALPSEPRRCRTLYSSSMPQGRLWNSSGCPIETPCFGAKRLFLQQSVREFHPRNVCACISCAQIHRDREMKANPRPLLLRDLEV